MTQKLITCPLCGAEMASGAKACPKCGAKNRKPMYKKWWFYVLPVVVVIAIIGGGGKKSVDNSAPVQSGSVQSGAAEKPVEESVSYAHYNVTELFDALDDNALKAGKAFQDQYVEIEGYLSTIDSDGKYICVGAADGDYAHMFDSVQCYMHSDEQREQVAELSSGDAITVRGKISDIGEILGYSMQIDSIN